MTPEGDETFVKDKARNVLMGNATEAVKEGLGLNIPSAASSEIFASIEAAMDKAGLSNRRSVNRGTLCRRLADTREDM